MSKRPCSNGTSSGSTAASTIAGAVRQRAAAGRKKGQLRAKANASRAAGRRFAGRGGEPDQPSPREDGPRATLVRAAGRANPSPTSRRAPKTVRAGTGSRTGSRMERTPVARPCRRRRFLHAARPDRRSAAHPHPLAPSLAHATRQGAFAETGDFVVAADALLHRQPGPRRAPTAHALRAGGSAPTGRSRDSPSSSMCPARSTTICSNVSATEMVCDQPPAGRG